VKTRNNNNKRNSKRKSARRNILTLLKTVSLGRVCKKDTYTVSSAIYAFSGAVSTINNYSLASNALTLNTDLFVNAAISGQSSNGLYGNPKFLKDTLLYGFYSIESALVIFHPNRNIPTTIQITSLPPLSMDVALGNTTFNNFQEYDTRGVMMVDFTQTLDDISQRYTFPGVYSQTTTGFPIMGSHLWLTTFGIGGIGGNNARDLQLIIGQDVSGTNVVTVGAASSQVAMIDVLFTVKWAHPQNPATL